MIRDLPLGMHPFAEQAAIAARCVGAQGDGMYRRYHDALFAAQTTLADSTFEHLARELRLDLQQFNTCRRATKIASAVRADAAEARGLRLNGTPAFVIGPTGGDSVTGLSIRGASPFERFRAAIDAVLQPVAVAQQ